MSTKDLGPLELKGITNPVPAVEIVYQHDPMALLRKLPFVGRKAEYETLLKKHSGATNGRGSVVLLAGEPGIGKTRLTEEFCEHASSSSVIIRGNCYEGDVSPPFGPWVEALRSLIEHLSDDDLREAAGEGAPEMAVLLPELRRRLPETGEAMKLDPESERARMFDAIATFLKNAAEQKPLVVFLDDLHWCDKPSLLLLEYVARGGANQRIIIVGTYRDVEVDRVHPLAQTLAALRRMEHHERLAHQGLHRGSSLRAADGDRAVGADGAGAAGAGRRPVRRGGGQPVLHPRGTEQPRGERQALPAGRDLGQQCDVDRGAGHPGGNQGSDRPAAVAPERGLQPDARPRVGLHQRLHVGGAARDLRRVRGRAPGLPGRGARRATHRRARAADATRSRTRWSGRRFTTS